MAWNPEVYNKFKEERYQPFYDMISHIQYKTNSTILDLGCGTGELTKILADKFSASRTLGIDNSAEMLQKAPQQLNLSFINRSIENQLEQEEKWDLIVANASLQWVEDHHTLLPKIISKLNAGGQLAIQMPSQKENIVNQLLHKLVQEEFYQKLLGDVVRHSPVLSLDDYTRLLIAHGAIDIIVYQKVYPIIAQSSDVFYDFISGTSLIPYMQKLDERMRPAFEQEFKARIDKAFTGSPKVYAFKRIILVARF